MRSKREEQHGFTLIELLVVIVILGILSAVVIFSVRGVTDKGSAAAAATDASTVRTAEEAFCAKFGRYGTEAELVNPPGGGGGFLASVSSINQVSLATGGNCGATGGPGTGGVNSAFTISTSPTAAVNIAANADSWITSDTGSNVGYSSSAFAYTLNSNLYDPLIIMASNYSLQPGLATSWELIPTSATRSPLPAGAPAYPTFGGKADRPYNTDIWRFHLRQGVLFQDGTAFNADAVMWSWRDRQPLNAANLTTVTGNLGYTHRLINQIPDQFDSVEKVDNFTVDFTPKIEDLRLPEQIAHPKGDIVEVGKHFDGSTAGLPASTNVFSSVRTGTTTTGSPTITNASAPFTAGDVGLTILGLGVPNGTQIVSVSGTSATMSKNATSTGGAGVTLTLASNPPATALVPATWNGGPANNNPIGTGPFSWVSYSPTNPQGGGTASFVANPTYWGTRPLVKQMNYAFIADATQRANALLSGQDDMAIDVDPTLAAQVNSAGDHIVTASYGQNALIYVNKVVKTTPASPLIPPSAVGTPASYTYNIGTDPAVREAASLAIDRPTYVNTIYNGFALPGRYMAPPAILGSVANQNAVPALAFNPGQAATLLDNDGWTCGNGAPAAATSCALNEIRKWNGASPTPFAAGRSLRLDLIGSPDIPLSGYVLLQSEMKAVGIDLHFTRADCNSSNPCPSGNVARSTLYSTVQWDFDLELPNQNDANPAFLSVLRMACLATNSNFRFAPVDGTNATGPSVTDTNANGGGTFPFGNNPCNLPPNTGNPLTSVDTSPGALGPFDNVWVPQSNTGDDAAAQQAAAQQMHILVNQDQTNVVIPVTGQYRIYGMKGNVNLGDPHPSQTSQRWVTLTKS